MQHRLQELAEIAAEEAIAALAGDPLDLIKSIRLREITPFESEGDAALKVVWRVDFSGAGSLPVSMLLLQEHLEDEEALVLSMAAWILHSLNPEAGPGSATA